MDEKVRIMFPTHIIRWELINPDKDDPCQNTMKEFYGYTKAEEYFKSLVREQCDLLNTPYESRETFTTEAWERGSAIFPAANVRITREGVEAPLLAMLILRGRFDYDPERYAELAWELPETQQWVSLAPLGRRDLAKRIIKHISAETWYSNPTSIQEMFLEPMAYSWAELQERTVNTAPGSGEQQALKKALLWMCSNMGELLTQEAILDIFYGVDDMGGHDIRRTEYPPLFDRYGEFFAWSDKKNDHRAR